MRSRVWFEELGGAGPRVLLLPGLGARGTGFRPLALALAEHARPVLVEYPTGHHAAKGAAGLAAEVLEAVGPADGIVASSFGGLVGAHLAAAGATRGLALVSSFTHTSQLGARASLIGLLGLVAELGRPGRFTAIVASASAVEAALVPEIVPTTALERRSVLHRAFAVRRDPEPPPLRERALACVCIQGDRDVLVPAGVLPRLLRALPPGTPGHLLRGAGHVPYLTHVERCAEILRPWLAQLGEGTSTGRAA